MQNDKNPWQRLSSRKIYDNPWIRVDEDRVLNPAGKPALYGRISFKNLAVGIIPVDSHGNTWLVGQHRYTLGAYSWEIPMGGSPLGEAPLQGAIRELKEETGLWAEQWSQLMRLHTSNSVTDEEGVVYVAQELTAGEPEFEETEDITIRQLPFDTAVEWVLHGTITDAISVAGLLKLAQVRGQYGF